MAAQLAVLTIALVYFVRRGIQYSKRHTNTRIYSKTYMDERKPLRKRRAAVSKTPNDFVQRSCSFPIIWPCVIPKQVPVHVPCHVRRELITDVGPHRTNDSTVTRKQHARYDA